MLSSLLIALTVASCTIPQGPPAHPQPPIAATAAGDLQRFADLEARLGGSWRAHWCAATGTPDRIVGTGRRLEGWRGEGIAEARSHARRQLDDLGDLLGLGTAEFREATGARMGNCWAFVYDQFVRGLPVHGGRADVRINTCGVLAMLGSTAVAVPADFDFTPTLPEEAAAVQAWLVLGLRPSAAAQPVPARAPRLVVWADVDARARTRPALAWEVLVRALAADGSGQLGRCYVDAHDGSLLRFESDKHECHSPLCRHAAHAHAAAAPARPATAIAPTTVTVMAWTRTGQSATGAPANVPLADFTVAVPGVGNVTTDANGQFTVDITAPVTITVTALDGSHCAPIQPPLATPVTLTLQPGVPATLQLFAANSPDSDLAYANAFYWSAAANRWGRSILGNVPALDVLDGVTPSVNLNSACNAFYIANTINFYAAGTVGSVCNNTAFSSVIVHEWGHGLDDRYGGISNVPGDGLSEGWGDIVAMYLLDSPDVGVDFFSIPGTVLRSGINTTVYGTQNEVHAAGQSWMGFAWLVRENLRQSLGSPAAIALSNSIVIGSIVANARNQTDAVLEVFLADDDDGNLLDGVPHYAELSGAAAQKGIPFPQQQIAVLTHTPLTNTNGQYGARGVSATSFAVTSGSIAQIQLTYSLNGGAPVTVPMVRDNRPTGYVGLIPGIVSGQVTYHVEAQHSSGYVVRSPTFGDHSYAVTLPAAGPFQGFYTEDFENGAPGWTHASVSGSGADDWQIGRVAGFQGSVNGIQWSDPLFPAAGQRCAGTAISGGGGGGGGGGVSGAYPANSDYYLRSPVIDCTGQVGVHLRFRRWLTVQDSTFDQATVRVNGVTIWTNAGGVHTIDTNWSLVEFVLPMADNNPSVQIEFHLTTDASIEFGGWAIDDFQLGVRPQPAPPPRLLVLPETLPANSPLTFSLQWLPNMPFLLYTTTTPGPTAVPGLPVLSLGGSIAIELGGITDAAGNWTHQVPTQPLGFGILGYTQVLTIDPSVTVFVSNPCANLLLP